MQPQDSGIYFSKWVFGGVQFEKWTFEQKSGVVIKKKTPKIGLLKLHDAALFKFKSELAFKWVSSTVGILNKQVEQVKFLFTNRNREAKLKIKWKKLCLSLKILFENLISICQYFQLEFFYHVEKDDCE